MRFQFSTHAAAGGNVAPSSAFENADLRITRANGGAAFSATQRSSANGITMASPFDSLTGFHDVTIDLTDDTDTGFYAAGYFYSVVLAPDETVEDSATLTGVVLVFRDRPTAGEHDAPGRLRDLAGLGRGERQRDAALWGCDSVSNPEAFFDGTGYTGTNNVIPTVTTLTATPRKRATPTRTSAHRRVRVSADIAAVHTKTTNLPSDPADHSAVIVATDAIYSRLGAPAGASVSADIAAAKTDTAAIKAKTDNLPSDPADQSLVIVATDAIYSRLGAPAGASVSADVAAVKGDSAAIKAKTDNLPASPAAVGSSMTLTSGERTSIAEALLKLDLSTITGEASRSVLNAVRFLRNKWSISGGTLTVRKEDDTTSAWTASVTQTAGNPVSEVNPA